MEHTPVLLAETMALLAPEPGENFIDCTFGRGGHAKVLLEKTAPNGIVIGLDWDNDNLENFKQCHEGPERLMLENINFARIAESTAIKKISRINGLLYDLGMSSWHIEQSLKGFSFSGDEPLDMRYDRNDPTTAAKILNEASLPELERIFIEFGQEKKGRKIAQAIVRARSQKKIETTGQLVLATEKIAPRHRNAILARIFQALRIAVNHELENVALGLEQGFILMAPGGRMAVISFHSLEDRIVKKTFRELVRQGKARYLAEKPIAPGRQEIAGNPRARSAKLRGIIKNG